MEYKNPVIEICNECELEIILDWNIKSCNYQAYCPFCGAPLMLCSACQDNGIKCKAVCPFKSVSEAKYVSPQEVSSIIQTCLPLGCFWTIDNDYFIAVDNRTGEAWTEEFKSVEEAMRWLR